MAENINISPDMISNLVNMLKNSNTTDSNPSSAYEVSKDEDLNTSNESRGIFTNLGSNSDSKSNTNNLDFETIMKIKSILETLNKKDDPKSKLLYSLKPYLRKSKQAKLDQYVNILKITQVTGLFNKKEGEK